MLLFAAFAASESLYALRRSMSLCNGSFSDANATGIGSFRADSRTFALFLGSEQSSLTTTLFQQLSSGQSEGVSYIVANVSWAYPVHENATSVHSGPWYSTGEAYQIPLSRQMFALTVGIRRCESFQLLQPALRCMPGLPEPPQNAAEHRRCLYRLTCAHSNRSNLSRSLDAQQQRHMLEHLQSGLRDGSAVYYE